MSFAESNDKFYRLQSQPRDPEPVLAALMRLGCTFCLTTTREHDAGCPYVRGDGGGMAPIYLEWGRKSALSNSPIDPKLKDDPSYKLGRRIGNEQRLLQDDGSTQAQMLGISMQSSN